MNTGTTARLNNVLFADGKFVAVGEGAVTLVSLDNGDTWHPTASAANTAWLRGLAYGGKVWVATGQSGTVIASVDGIAWTLRNSTGEDLEAVTLAQSTTGESSDGETIAYSHFLAVGQSGVSRLMTATVSTAPAGPHRLVGFYPGYSSFLIGTTARLRSLTMVNTLFIATGENGAVYSAAF